MRRLVLMAAIVAATLTGIKANAAPAAPELYPDAGIVTGVDTIFDIVYWNDGNNKWYFHGTEDWNEGDGIAVIMSDNGTPDVKDDYMVGSPRYISIMN